MDETIKELLLDYGPLGVMAVGLWAFIKGKIIPYQMHQEAIEALKENSEANVKLLAKEIGESIEDGVARGIKQGIVEGYLEVNNRGASNEA